MAEFLVEFLGRFRIVFTRRAAFAWFVVVFIGLAIRTDWLGTASLIRALDLSPALYPHLLHFFHASSWNGELLLLHCLKWLKDKDLFVLRNGRLVLFGDESKTPKEGRRMPAVKTLRQTSETSSKPSYFRGHEWGFIGVLIGSAGKCFCAPAWARLSEGAPDGADEGKKGKKAGGVKRRRKKREGGARTAGIVKAASGLALSLGLPAYLVLDAFYAVGPVFKAASEAGDIFIVTKAKGNCTARVPYTGPRKGGRGKPRQFEKTVKVHELFTTNASAFETRRACVYGRHEDVSVMSIALNWKVAGTLVLFVLATTSRGPVVLMCSDLRADPVDVLELYCHRSLIEVMFNNVKNLLGLMEYRFWSKHLEPQTRRPVRNSDKRTTTNPKATERTIAAMSNFLHVGLVLLAFLQALSCKFGVSVAEKADCWLRTPSGAIPSEFVAKIALGCILRRILNGSGENPIAEIIHAKMKSQEEDVRLEDAA
jgi:hypothetical protein